jgi:predicted  nucleic acid-binding Zn-ribbon protein
MARGHEIKIAADTRDFERGIRDGIIDPIDEAEDTLEQLGKADAGESLERDFKKAQKATERLDDSLGDVRRELKKVGSEAKDTGADGAKGMRRLSDAGEEATGELRQNLGETFSSFRGDLEDLPQIAQDVFGGLAGSVDSLVGSLALAGGAAGIGLLIAGFQAIQEQEEKRKERISEWATAYIGGLSTMGDALADFASVEEIYTDTDRYAEAKKNAEDWGVSVSTAVNAMAGDASALAVVNDTLSASEDRVADAVDNLNGGKLSGLSHEMRILREQASEGRESFNNLTSEMDAGRAIADQYSDSLLSMVRGAEGAEVSVDELGNTVYALPDGQEILIDAKTGKATSDVSKFKGDADDVIEHLNAQQITLRVNTALRDAQNDVNRFIKTNEGRSFKIHGRFQVDPGRVLP